MIVEVTDYKGDREVASCTLPINFGQILDCYEKGEPIIYHINYLGTEYYKNLFGQDFKILKTEKGTWLMFHDKNWIYQEYIKQDPVTFYLWNNVE